MKLNNVQLNLAYMAGIWDGEGCFSIAKEKRKFAPVYHVVAALEMTNQKIVQLFKVFYGGNITTRKRKTNKRSYIWRGYNKRAAQIAWDLTPFLRLKKKQANLVTKFVALNGQRKNKLRESFYLKMKELNA